MQEEVPTKAIAACFGLAGFVVAIVCGLVVDNPTEETLGRAVAAMFVCVVVGYGIGVYTTRAISQNIQAAASAATAAAAEAAETAARMAQQEIEGTGGAAGTKSASQARATPTTAPITTPAPPRATPPSRKAAA